MLKELDRKSEPPPGGWRPKAPSRAAAVLLVLGLVLAPTLALGAAGSEEVGATFLAAARGGDLATVQRLVEAGVPVDTADAYGTTALSAAAAKGHLEVVRFLLASGADPDRKESFYGIQPLSWALFNAHFEIARLLLAAGAADREEALQAAVEAKDTELARAAVEAGPIHQSTLTALRSTEGLPPALAQLLADAESRPDPLPPIYSPKELEAFTGRFEGVSSDVIVDVEIRDGALLLGLVGEPMRRLTAVGEQRFRSAETGGQSSIEAAFSGRAGTIEGMALLRPGTEPEALRRSVAEPVAASPRALAELEVARAEGVAVPKVGTVQWPGFRGPNATGIGDGTDTPVEWDLETGDGVLWRAPIPGLGNSSPVVWGDRVFVTTAVAEGAEQTIRTGLTGAGDPVEESVEHRWTVLAFDKRTGQRLWQTEIGRGVPLTRRHFKATQANSTPVTDGRHLVVVFPTAGMACLGLDGSIHWRHDLGGLNAGAFNDPGIEWGFASSPILYGGRVILQVDVHDGQYLAAWDLETGELAWRTERQVAPSWATPAVLATPSGDELVVNGSTIHGYDPTTGRELWSLGPNSELVIATPVVGDGVVYVSAGYPPVKPVYAVPAGLRGDLRVDPKAGDPRLTWSLGIGGAYMPTPILYRGLYYIVHHNGRLVAYAADTGDALYKTRFSRGGTFTGSPVAVNGKLYLTTEEGLLYVLAAGPEYRELAVHDFAEPLMTTPAVSEGILLLRTTTQLLALSRQTQVDQKNQEERSR